MRKGKKPTPPAPPSARYRFFCWSVAFLSLAQLVVGLDYINIWPGAEAELIWSAFGTEANDNVLTLLLGTLPADASNWLLAYRLPGLLFYLLGLGLFFWWGRPLFGQKAVETTLLVGAASLLLPVLAKTATLDTWRFGLELGCWLALLHFTKKPTRAWLLWCAGLGALAVLVGSWATLVLLLIWQVAYYRILIPARPELKSAFGKPFVIIYIVFIASYLIGLAGGYSRSLADFYTYHFLNLGHLKFFGYALLGLSPFIGFTLAGIRDLFYKVKRGEELSQLLLVGLLGSMLTLSLVFPFLLIFLTAKQVENFFKVPNYPWEDWAKAGQVLHLILVFLLVILALLGGYVQFQIDGFRAVLGCSAAYWMFSFMGVVGLYGKKRDQVLGGTVLAGLISLLFFWIQVYPFVHLQRNWPQRLQTQITKELPEVRTIRIAADDPLTLPLGPYLTRAGYTVARDSTSANDLFIERLEPADTSRTFRVEVTGWAGLWGAERWGGE